MVPNAYATIGTHSPTALLGVMLSVDGVFGNSSHAKADIEAIRLAVSWNDRTNTRFSQPQRITQSM
ncbi:hypothetical protein PQR46_39985 [Paraburkholderia sediminicola]|uniref:hypothetical protein n=1 Tax=Paraburkholderia sediminicola TaxID=458836 RepID=UPI0038BAB3FD